MIKSMIKPAAVLLIITSIAAALLGFVSEITKDAIEKQTNSKQSEAMQEVLPDAKSFEVYENAEFTGTIQNVYVGYTGGEIVGYVFNLAPNGFGGKIGMMVGMGTDGITTGLRITEHSETKGLGEKAAVPSFYEQFTNTQAPLSLIKSGTPSDNEIQAITGATITSKAVMDASNEAYEWFASNIGGAK